MAFFWRNLLGGDLSGAGSRQKGIQTGTPSYYSKTPAESVTPDTAMQLSAVWGCVKLIAETVGSLPLRFFKISPDGVRTPYNDHPLAILFASKPNRWQTRQEFFETMTYQLAMTGNGYAAIQRGAQNRIIGLIPLMSSQMRAALNETGDMMYEYQDNASTTPRAYASTTIWHNKLFGNGVIGLSPLAHARDSIGIGQAAETAVGKIYRNGGKPSGILSIDKILTKIQRDKIKENFSELAEGNNDRLFVLEAGMDFKQVSLSPQDIELLSSRRFQIETIARFFGVPSVLINDASATSVWGSGIQTIIEGWYKLGLRPYLERYQDSMKAWLLQPNEFGKVDIEFDLSELLQPSFAERVKTYKEAVTGGLITPNEARKLESMAPAPGGDSIYMQQQMVPLEQLKDLDRSASSTNTASTPHLMSSRGG